MPDPQKKKNRDFTVVGHDDRLAMIKTKSGDTLRVMRTPETDRLLGLGGDQPGGDKSTFSVEFGEAEIEKPSFDVAVGQAEIESDADRELAELRAQDAPEAQRRLRAKFREQEERLRRRGPVSAEAVLRETKGPPEPGSGRDLLARMKAAEELRRQTFHDFQEHVRRSAQELEELDRRDKELEDPDEELRFLQEEIARRFIPNVGSGRTR
ncbi:MAG: hypothetical protein GWN58_58685 [Anaerolineae bacterium]|nr:hypothetical protein [Anaerolineae bacterium]